MQPAAADCAGPTYSHAVGEFNHGDTLTIEGMYWGDNCYDTGPPPAGEGDIGLPIGNIEIVLVQGDTEILVASGNADEEYGFEVDVVVPTGLEAGAFEVAARPAGSVGSSYNMTQQNPVYSPADKRLVPVVEATFGPSEPITFVEPATDLVPREPAEASPPSDGETDYLWLALGTFAVGFAVTVMVARRR